MTMRDTTDTLPTMPFSALFPFRNYCILIACLLRRARTGIVLQAVCAYLFSLSAMANAQAPTPPCIRAAACHARFACGGSRHAAVAVPVRAHSCAP